MPFTQFICPDEKRVDIKDCIHKCRLGERCLSKPTIMAIGQQRIWNGKPSTTQLLKGAREVFLEIKKDYAIKPQNRIFAIFGTSVHWRLETQEVDNSITEIRLEDDTATGQPDYYDREEGILYDYKTYGSYKAAKVLGKVKQQQLVGYYKNGNPQYKQMLVDGPKDRLDLAIQLNHYRTLIELQGEKVKKLVAEILVRDGGTYLAKQRGILENAFLVEINKISDRWINRYLSTKAKRIHDALEKDEMPQPCSKRETWGGKKCEEFCDVWEHCPIGIKKRKEVSE